MNAKNTIAYFDGSNFYATCKALNMKIDFKEMAEMLTGTFNCKRLNYYTALLNTDETQSIIPLIDWMDYNGYNIIRKEAKSYTNDGVTKIKGNVDVEIAVDMICHSKWAKIMVLFSGDADFRYLVNYLQNQGVYVYIVSSIKTNPPMCGDALRRQADCFIDLIDIADAITNSKE